MSASARERRAPGVPHSGARGSTRARIGCALLLAVVAGCRATPPPPLAHTFDTPEALASAVLDAIARHDDRALAALPVAREEFETLVWPALPSSRPDVGLPVEYAWQDLHQKSRGFMTELLDGLGGQRFELVALTFTGTTTDHGTFRVHRDTMLTVRDERGRERTLRAFGSILERDGRFKLFSYITD